ncbi:MAG: DUF6057 family protein, partial [bacterium]|nr:DUF6057 family protein [bacterium]
MRLWFGRGGFGPLRVAAPFGLLYLYVWLRIDPSLIYHVQEPVFHRGWTFFRHFLVIPGGPTEYMAALLGQTYVLPWLGALVVTLVAAGICAASWGVVRSLGGHPPEIVAYAPAVLLLILHNRYRYDLALDLALLLPLVAAVSYCRLPISAHLLRSAVLLAISLPLYWVVGGPFLLFPLLCAIREALIARRIAWAVACLAVGAGLPYLATLTLYPGTLSDAYLHLLPFRGDYTTGAPRVVLAAVALYAFVPVLAVMEVRRGARDLLTGVRRHMANAVLTLLGVLLVYGTFDGNYKTMLKIDVMTRSQRWEEVLSASRNLTAYNVLTVYNVQRALCHLGRLSVEMFSYPHLESASMFTPSPETPTRLLVLCDNLFEMGQVNKAEHMAQEALEIFGDRPSILKRLVAINVVKGRPEAARVYLGLLEKSPIAAGWARHYMEALAADPQRLDDVDLSRARSRMLDKDYPGFFATEIMLLQSLAQNPRNILAFDMLMGSYLQMGQLDKIVDNIGNLSLYPERFAPGTLPRLYEEAIMLYLTRARQQFGTMPQIPMYGREIGTPTMQRFSEFSQVLAAHQGDRTRARPELAEKYGD